MFDVKRFVDELHEYFSRALTPLASRIKALEDREIPVPRDGIDGHDGKDGSDGRNGKDGRDGLGFEDMSVEYDGARTFSWKFVRGGFVKEASFTLPVVLDQGVFREGQTYVDGDGVTWGGSYFIAQKNAPVGKPGEPGSDGWRLAVKRGKDGRDGRNGIDKTVGMKL